MSFFNDGNVITDEVPSPFETSGHGNWVSTGRAEAAYAFEALVGNTDGNLLYRLKVSGTVEYNVRTDTWNGPFNIDIYDADGNLVLADTGTMSGTRIIVEP